LPIEDKDDVFPLALPVNQTMIGFVASDFDIPNLVDSWNEEDLRDSKNCRDVVVVRMSVANRDEVGPCPAREWVQPGRMAALGVADDS
jgi:hypothetical protein